jgi:DNA-binding helix-hairpin-helix protein with protein kinase domain
MNYPLSEIDGMTATGESKLKAAGIRSASVFLEKARSVKGRKTLAEKTGLSEKQLLEWANSADAMRIPGVGKTKVALLRAAGVNTVRELGYRNPERLTKSMCEANASRKLLRARPTTESVGKMIEFARKLPIKISY